MHLMNLFIFTLYLMVALAAATDIFVSVGKLSAINNAITIAPNNSIITLETGVWSQCDEAVSLGSKYIVIRGSGDTIIRCDYTASVDAVFISEQNCAGADIHNLTVDSYGSMLNHHHDCHVLLHNITIYHAQGVVSLRSNASVKMTHCSMIDTYGCILLDESSRIEIISSRISGIVGYPIVDATSQSIVVMAGVIVSDSCSSLSNTFIIKTGSVLNMTSCSMFNVSTSSYLFNIMQQSYMNAIGLTFANVSVPGSSIISISEQSSVVIRSSNFTGDRDGVSAIIAVSNSMLSTYDVIMSYGTKSCLLASGVSIIVLNDALFHHCSSPYAGGGVFIYEESVLTAYNMTITDSTSKGGGCLAVEDSSANIYDSLFERCSTGTLGGAASIVGSVVEMEHTILRHCTAQEGGAILGLTSNITLTDVMMYDNAASNMGGCLSLTLVDSQITGGKLHGCSSEVNGGCVYSLSSNLSLHDYDMYNCSSNNGGGMDVYYGAIVADNLQVSDCYAKRDGGAFRVVALPTFELVHSTVSQCRSDGDGGAFHLAYLSNLTMYNSSITRCAASSGGCAYATKSSEIHLYDHSVISYGTAVDNGGLVVIDAQSLLYSYESDITEGEASNGGCVYSYMASIVLEHSRISRCTATLSGGAMYLGLHSTGSVSYSSVFDCSAAVSGGCVMERELSRLYLTNNSEIYNGSSSIDGGCVMIDRSSDMVMTSSHIHHCRATHGSCINGDCANINITSSIISYCDTELTGALYLTSDSKLMINDSTLSDCMCGYAAGGLYLDNVVVATITHSNMNRIRNTGYGGAVFVTGAASFTASDVTMSDNTAYSGACMYVETSGSVDLIGCKLTNCNGSCIEARSSMMTMTNTEISYATSSNSGAAVALSRQSFVILSSSHVHHCTAVNNGGCIHSYDAKLSLYDTSLSSGSANNGGCVSLVNSEGHFQNAVIDNCRAVTGGAVHLQQSNSVKISYSTISNSTADGGGGIRGIDSSIELIHTIISRNDGGGVLVTGGHVDGDDDTRICRNFPYQINATTRGNPVICGYITMVTAPDGPWLPGDVITVHGHDMLNGTDDVIVRADEFITEQHSIPFNFTTTERNTSYFGALLVTSLHGVQSESYNNYVIMAYDYHKCIDTTVISVQPSRVLVSSSSVYTTISLYVSCSRTPDLRLYFGNDVIHCVTGDGNWTCSVPRRYVPGVVMVTVEVTYSLYQFNLTEHIPFTYYDMPEPTSALPLVAHNSTTNITVCGAYSQGDWHEPRCLFGEKHIEIANFINESCILCRYFSNHSCSDRQSNTLRVSLYLEQFSSQSFSIKHVCVPKFDGRLSPGFIVVNTTGHHVLIPGYEFVSSDYLSCKFDSEIMPGNVSDAGLTCPIPGRAELSTADLSISNDGQSWYATAPFYYLDDKYSCDKNTEFNQYTCLPCPENTYKPHRSPGKCITCRSGGYCAGGVDPVPLEGYYDDGDEYVQCMPSYACLRNSECAVGYEGVRCSRCAPGYSRNQLACIECSGSFSYFPVLGFVLVVCSIMTYLFVQAFGGPSSNDALAALTIGVGFLQVFALVGSVPSNGQMAEPFRTTFNKMSTLNYDLQALSLDCALGYNYFQMLALKSVYPLMCISYIWSLAGVWYLCGIKTTTQIIRAAVSTTVVMFVMLYIAITAYVLSFISCSKLERGPWVLDASPDIECFGTEHLNNLWIFVIGMIVYVIGVPFTLYYIVVIKRRQLLTKGDIPEWYTFCFGFLSLKYHDYVYWWELCVMARKALLVVAFTIWSHSLAVKLMLTVIVLIVALYHQNWYKPMTPYEIDRMESITLSANAVVLTVAQTVLIARTSDSLSEETVVLVNLLFVLFIMLCVSIVMWMLVFVFKLRTKQKARENMVNKKMATDDVTYELMND